MPSDKSLTTPVHRSSTEGSRQSCRSRHKPDGLHILKTFDHNSGILRVEFKNKRKSYGAFAFFCALITNEKKKYLTFNTIISVVKVKVKQSRYRPGVAQWVPGS